MPQPGRESDVRFETTSLTKLMVSPASTGLIQRSSRKPGDGPHIATCSPRAANCFARRWSSATRSLIKTEATCQPDAARPPNSDLRPSSSSRWKRCGSNFAANVLMLSAKFDPQRFHLDEEEGRKS